MVHSSLGNVHHDYVIDLKGNKEPGNAAIQENILHQGPALSCWWSLYYFLFMQEVGNKLPTVLLRHRALTALCEITRAIHVHTGNLLHLGGKCSRHR